MSIFLFYFLRKKGSNVWSQKLCSSVVVDVQLQTRRWHHSRATKIAENPTAWTRWNAKSECVPTQGRCKPLSCYTVQYPVPFAFAYPVTCTSLYPVPPSTFYPVSPAFLCTSVCRIPCAHYLRISCTMCHYVPRALRVVPRALYPVPCTLYVVPCTSIWYLTVSSISSSVMMCTSFGAVRVGKNCRMNCTKKKKKRKRKRHKTMTLARRRRGVFRNKDCPCEQQPGRSTVGGNLD